VVAGSLVEAVAMEIAEVLEPASFAVLDVTISVQFRDFVGIDPAAPVKAVAVLADDVLTNA